VTKREWQIEMANRFAKRDNDIEELDTRSYLIGRYDSTKTLTDAQETIRQLTAKLECYERLVDANNMASNPMSIKSRVALRNVREMKTIMTKEEEILRAVEAEREACAKVCETLWDTPTNGMATEEEAYGDKCAAAIRARGQA
jgi:hypothetical protein